MGKKWQKDKQTTAFCMLCVRARVQDKKNIVSDFTISIRMQFSYLWKVFYLILSLYLSLLIFYSRIMDTEKWMQCNAMQNAANQSQTQPNVTKRKILLLAAYSRDRSAGYE